ncbi:MAG: hypothetical protein EWV54_00450 [Microcystis novacekii Mn_MB_F_20050700_S1D]|uniref:Uncharacterized protein n=1 Tax=Microcystis novacekii Mn_MB_F_20050700_S1D TaxID=2486266 RepID=A0A552JD00_9CHRO|nr:MAG: hypothetical protein EWV54_00450 [Microcystis novacekii Mn_MB_F_20050700_S1D]
MPSTPHLNPQFQSMCMVRSPKSITGAVGATLGNAPYKIALATFWIVAEKCQVQRFVALLVFVC